MEVISSWLVPMVPVQPNIPFHGVNADRVPTRNSRHAFQSRLSLKDKMTCKLPTAWLISDAAYCAE